MKLKCSFISRHTKDHHHLYIPGKWMDRFPFQRHMTLKCGSSLLDVTCMETKTDSLQIMLDTSDSLFASIPPLQNIWISIDTRNTMIHMGPVVALLLNQSSLETIHSHSLNEYFTECQEWFQRKGGFFYLLPLSSFVGNKGEGLYYNGNDWETGPLPDPHVLYNRCHSRKTERSPSFQKALGRSLDGGIQVFNSGFLSKDQVYNALKDSPVLSTHLPETVKGLHSLEKLLTLYHDVFIKGINGSKGRYIMRIKKRDGGYHMQQNSFSPENPLTFPTYTALYNQLKAWCNSSYLVQETIPFLTVEGLPLDFRFLCHQNRDEDWEVVSSVARIASQDQFVANVDQGGRIEKPLMVLQTIFSPKESMAIMKEMKELCIHASTLLADSLEGHFAELGIDIGIDKAGKPWVIEINSKPSKRTYLENDRIRPSVKALYEYSLANWTNKEE